MQPCIYIFFFFFFSFFLFGREGGRKKRKKGGTANVLPLDLVAGSVSGNSLTFILNDDVFFIFMLYRNKKVLKKFITFEINTPIYKKLEE